MDVDQLQILMSTDTLSEVWFHSLDLARALAPFDVYIHLAAMGAMPDAAKKKEAAGLQNLTLHSSNWQLEWMDSPWEDVEAAGHWLRYLQSEIRPDLIHLNHYALGSLSWRSPVLITAHGTLLSRWEKIKGGPPPELYSLYRAHVRKGLQAANCVVASTQSQLDELEQYFGPLNRVQLIRDSISAPLARTTAKQPFMLAASSFGDESANLEFCEALAARGLSWPLLIAGTDKAQHGQPVQFPNLHMLGKSSQEEFSQRLAAAAMYLHPVNYDPSGRVVLQAAQAGCCLVLADLPNLRELWDGAALFISLTDAATAHQQIEKLLQHKKERQLLAHQAQLRARQFSPAQQGEAYFKLYQQIIGEYKQEAAQVARELKKHPHKK